MICCEQRLKSMGLPCSRVIDDFHHHDNHFFPLVSTYFSMTGGNTVFCGLIPICSNHVSTVDLLHVVPNALASCLLCNGAPRTIIVQTHQPAVSWMSWIDSILNKTFFCRETSLNSLSTCGFNDCLICFGPILASRWLFKWTSLDTYFAGGEGDLEERQHG